MQNDEYLKLYEAEWQKMLGQKEQTVTEAERKELRELMIKTKEGKPDVH